MLGMPEEEKGFQRSANLGSVAHALMANQPSLIQVLDYDSYRTKACKDERDEALAADKIPCLKAEMTAAQAMVKAARKQLRATDASDAFTNGKPEQTIIWQEDGRWFRVRPDWLPDQEEGDLIIDDYKTTTGSARPEDWAKRVMIETACDLQDVFYARGIRAMRPGLRTIRMRFIVQEQKFPYAISVIRIGPETLERAGRRMKEGIASWRWSLERDRWPGYSKHTYEVEAPGWHLTQWANEEIYRSASQQLGQDLKEEMIEWQSPHEVAA